MTAKRSSRGARTEGLREPGIHNHERVDVAMDCGYGSRLSLRSAGMTNYEIFSPFSHFAPRA